MRKRLQILNTIPHTGQPFFFTAFHLKKVKFFLIVSESSGNTKVMLSLNVFFKLSRKASVSMAKSERPETLQTTISTGTVDVLFSNLGILWGI